jgi:hypothetical protein
MAKSPDGPYTVGFVPPVANAAYTTAAYALYVGGTGNVSVRMAGGGNTTFVGVPAGTTLRVVHNLLYSNTSATNLVALY